MGRLRRAILIPIPILVLVAGLLPWIPAQAFAHDGVDAFIGVGASEDPTSDVPAGLVLLGGGIRPSPNLSLGANGLLTMFAFEDHRVLVGMHAKVHVLPTWPVRPYGLLGIGFLDIALNPQVRDTEWQLMPKIGIGAEIGWKSAALFGELARQTEYRGTMDFTSLSVGLTLRFAAEKE